LRALIDGSFAPNAAHRMIDDGPRGLLGDGVVAPALAA
jgi:hypothetical protein